MHNTEFEDLSLAVSLSKALKYYGTKFYKLQTFALSEGENWHYRFSEIYVSTGNAGFMNISEERNIKNINNYFLFNILY